MDFKKIKAEVTTVTRDMDKLMKLNPNIYETVVILAKRADQIAMEMKEELTNKLEQFKSHTDNLEEIFENKEQIEVSRYYEHLPKPAAIAIAEFMEGRLHIERNYSESEEE